MFVAFGSTVLVPLLVGFDPAIALLAAGLGTLLFHAVTGGKVPIYLGSSFAFIAPIIKATELYGMAGMFCGLVAVGMVYILMSFLVKLFGVNFIKKLFPPIVIGPVIILIGLSLAGTGVDMASKNWVLALVSFSWRSSARAGARAWLNLSRLCSERSRATSWPWYSTEAQWISPESPARLGSSCLISPR